MTTLEKMKILQQKVNAGIPIRVMFADGKVWTKFQGNLVATKDKTTGFRDHIAKDSRFKVLVGRSMPEMVNLYRTSDLVVPPQQYDFFTCLANIDTKRMLERDRKILNIRYSLGWHKIVQNDIYSTAYLNCVDDQSICEHQNDVLTGHPWAELLNLPKEHFPDPWPATSKKRILICPHHSVGSKPNRYGNHSSSHEVAQNVLNLIQKYHKDAEFVMRPHPNLLFRYQCNQLDDSDAISLIESGVTISIDKDYIGWLKWSDAMIHDCGSFRCEYLFMDRPVCYMANDINMDPKIWSDMGKEAIDCHEIAWLERGDTLDGFVQNVIEGRDDKAELRRRYIERHCSSYPNGKTPCENIVNAILGQEEYAYLNSEEMEDES